MRERPGSESVLPSLGQYYGDSLPGGVCNVMAMRTVEEKLFSGLSRRADVERVLDDLIKRCTDLTVAPDKLLLGDRTYLMMKIRAVSYGVDYAFQAACPSCGTKFKSSVNLDNDLEVKYATEGHEEPWDLELPYSKDIVTIRFIRGFDERSILRMTEQNLKNTRSQNPGDPSYIYRLAHQIIEVKVDGKVYIDRNDKAAMSKMIKYVEEVAAPDSSAIRESVDQVTPGLMMAITRDCPSCRDNFDMIMPMTGDWFRTATVA